MAEAKDVAVNVLTSTITTLVIIFLLIPMLKIPVPAVKETETIKEKYYYPYVMPVQVEGDYSTWTFMWKRYYHNDVHPAPIPNQLSVSESSDLLILADGQNSNLQVLKLSDGTLLSETAILQSDYHSWIVPSAMVKYFAVVVAENGIPKLKIYKDARLTQTIDLKATLGWTLTSADYITAFSRDGKYLFVSNVYSGTVYTPVYEYALFKGS